MVTPELIRKEFDFEKGSSWKYNTVGFLQGILCSVSCPIFESKLNQIDLWLQLLHFVNSSIQLLRFLHPSMAQRYSAPRRVTRYHYVSRWIHSESIMGGEKQRTVSKLWITPDMLILLLTSLLIICAGRSNSDVFTYLKQNHRKRRPEFAFRSVPNHWILGYCPIYHACCEIKFEVSKLLVRNYTKACRTNRDRER